MFPADLHRLYHRIGGFGNNNPDRYLAVIRGIGGIQRAAAGVETDLAVDPELKFRLQSTRIQFLRDVSLTFFS
jgi:hypothetical protein